MLHIGPLILTHFFYYGAKQWILYDAYFHVFLLFNPDVTDGGKTKLRTRHLCELLQSIIAFAKRIITPLKCITPAHDAIEPIACMHLQMLFLRTIFPNPEVTEVFYFQPLYVRNGIRLLVLTASCPPPSHRICGPWNSRCCNVVVPVWWRGSTSDFLSAGKFPSAGLSKLRSQNISFSLSPLVLSTRGCGATPAAYRNSLIARRVGKRPRFYSCSLHHVWVPSSRVAVVQMTPCAHTHALNSVSLCRGTSCSAPRLTPCSRTSTATCLNLATPPPWPCPCWSPSKCSTLSTGQCLKTPEMSETLPSNKSAPPPPPTHPFKKERQC